MKKTNPRYTIIACILLLIFLGITYMWPFKNKSSLPKTVETRNFSCPGMEGFTFEYPVLGGFDYQGVELKALQDSTDKSLCHIYLNKAQFSANSETRESAPRIDIRKVSLPEKQNEGKWLFGPISPSSKKNPQGITYDQFNSDSLLKFYTDTFGVSIVSINFNEKLRDAFFQSVVKSFRLTNMNQEKPKQIIVDRFCKDVKAGRIYVTILKNKQGRIGGFSWTPTNGDNLTTYLDAEGKDIGSFHIFSDPQYTNEKAVKTLQENFPIVDELKCE